MNLTAERTWQGKIQAHLKTIEIIQGENRGEKQIELWGLLGHHQTL